jgi:methylmalonyl-CoA mutase
MVAVNDLSLAADFPQATREQWLKLVEGVLKDADFQKRLVSSSHDGIAIQPLYPKAEGSTPVRREQAGRWRVSQRVDHPDPSKANELALADLEGGADALTLVTRKALRRDAQSHSPARRCGRAWPADGGARAGARQAA